MVNTNTSQQEPCTVEHSVRDVAATPNMAPFSVKPGVPFSAAFENLDLLLGCARDCLEEIAAKLNSDLGWAVVRQIEQAEALVSSMHTGYLQWRKRR